MPVLLVVSGIDDQAQRLSSCLRVFDQPAASSFPCPEDPFEVLFLAIQRVRLIWFCRVKSSVKTHGCSVFRPLIRLRSLEVSHSECTGLTKTHVS